MAKKKAIKKKATAKATKTKSKKLEWWVQVKNKDEGPFSSERKARQWCKQAEEDGRIKKGWVWANRRMVVIIEEIGDGNL